MRVMRANTAVTPVPTRLPSQMTGSVRAYLPSFSKA